MSEEQKVDAALKYADNNHLDYQESHDTYDDIYDAFLGGIDYALSHQWISVDERMPEKSNNYLVIICIDGCSPRTTFAFAKEVGLYTYLQHVK